MITPEPVSAVSWSS